MKYCLLAMHKQNQYVSIPHYYCDTANLCDELNQNHRSTAAAEKIIANGDLLFFDGTSLSQFRSADSSTWNKITPIVLRNAISLVEHALSVKATHIVCYEGNYWFEIPLSEIELNSTVDAAAV